MSPIWLIMKAEIDLAVDQALRELHEQTKRHAQQMGIWQEYSDVYYGPQKDNQVPLDNSPIVPIK